MQLVSAHLLEWDLASQKCPRGHVPGEDKPMWHPFCAPGTVLGSQEHQVDQTHLESSSLEGCMEFYTINPGEEWAVHLPLCQLIVGSLGASSMSIGPCYISYSPKGLKQRAGLIE